MKTGRLLKFRSAEGDVQAYLYRDGKTHRAAVYVSRPGIEREPGPTHSLSGSSEEEVEAAVRSWVAENVPPAR